MKEKIFAFALILSLLLVSPLALSIGDNIGEVTGNIIKENETTVGEEIENVTETLNETEENITETVNETIENVTEKVNETIEEVNQTIRNKTEEFLGNLTTTTVEGAAVPVPESLEDEVENNKPEVPKTGYSHAFLLLNKEKYYLVFSKRDIDKGCGSIEGKLLPKSVSWKGNSLSFVLGQEISISQEGKETTIQEIRQNPKQYRYKCVDLDATVRELSALYDPDQGNEITLPTSTGIVIKDPVTASEFVKKIRDKSEQLVKNPENEKVKEMLQNEKEYLPIFDFKTKFWTGSRADIDGIVLDSEEVLKLVEDKGEGVKNLVYSTNNATLYSIKENLRVKKLDSIEETFTRSDELRGKTISFEARGYGKLFSVQEEIEHNTGCGNDKIPVEGGCVNVPVDVLLHGVVAFSNFGKFPANKTQARKRVLVTVAASSHHEDEPSKTVKGRFKYTGKLVSAKQINESLPKGLGLIVFQRKRIGNLNYTKLAEEEKDAVEERIGDLESILSEEMGKEKQEKEREGSGGIGRSISRTITNVVSSVGNFFTGLFV